MLSRDDLGTPIDWTPARAPGPVVLEGRSVRLEPLDPAVHAADLFAAASAGDPRLWDYLPYGPFPTEEGFRDHLEASVRGENRFFVIVPTPAAPSPGTGDAGQEAPAGMIAFGRIAPERGRIEIGHVWFGTALQRTPAATEAVWLLARHAFKDLGNRRLEWKCDALNARSHAAAERFGFTHEGTFRQDLIVKGRNRDTAWFSILDGEWPAIDAGFCAWLAPDNFDPAGNQRHSLRELREQ